MAALVGNIQALLLTIAGAFYLLWAAGSTFPFANEQSLARSVIGHRGITRVPSRRAFLYLGVLLLAAALAAFLMGGFSEMYSASKVVLAPLGLILAFVFLIRGVAGVLPAFERAAPEQPYLRLNRRLYSPFCLLIGAGFLFLVASLPNWTERYYRLING